MKPLKSVYLSASSELIAHFWMIVFDCQNNLLIFRIPSTIRVRLNELDAVQSLSRYCDEV
jgi:hypothetical protein